MGKAGRIGSEVPRRACEDGQGAAAWLPAKNLCGSGLKRQQSAFMITYIIQNPKRVVIISLVIGLLVYLFLISSANQGSISIAVKDGTLSLAHSSGDSFEIRFKDIQSVTEAQDLDLGRSAAGAVPQKYNFGAWENGQFGSYKLCAYDNVTHYIVVKTTSEVFVFNLESESATDQFYKELLTALEPAPGSGG